MANKETVSNKISIVASAARSLKITWEIDEFFSLPVTSGYSMDSPSFIFANASWCIRLYPNGRNESTSTDFSLVRLNSLVPSNVIICKFDIEMPNLNNEELFGYFEFSFDENFTLGNFNKKMCSRSQMAKYKEDFSLDGKITFLCHLLCEESGEENTFSTKASHKIDSSRTLCQDFKNLLLNGPNHDLTLKVKDKEFRVHQNILSSRSHVFHSMLSHDMIEKNSGVVDVPDCDPPAMEQLLLYLYCGEIDNLNKDNMLGLYYAADKYDMKHLKEKCREFIKNSLHPCNICEVVQLATNHSDRGLLECATEFFVINTKKILVTSEWLSFMKENVDIANELLIKASKKWSD